MRARNIKPGIYKNEQLAACSIPARWLFPGLWAMADWCGRLEDRPLRIKMEIFPADVIAIEPLLVELAAAGLIFRYRAAGPDGEQGYIWIPKFRKHQSPHQNEREKPSLIPAHPEDDESDLKPVRAGSKSATGVLPECSENGPGGEPEEKQSNRAESRILNPEPGMLNAETRNPKPDGPRPAASSTRVGGATRGASPPSSVSAVLPQLDPEWEFSAKQRLLSSIMDLGDGPEYEAWWKVVINRMEAAEGLGVLLEAVDKAVGCGDPTVRARKDWGELSKPSAFVASVCGKHLKLLGRSLPRAPGPTKVARVGGQGSIARAPR